MGCVCCYPKLSAADRKRPHRGPYDAEYDSFQGPAEASAGATLDATVRVINRSWRTWDSFAETDPVFLSYHWLDTRDGVVVKDGLRSPLPRHVAQGDSCRVALRIQCPAAPSRYILAVEPYESNDRTSLGRENRGVSQTTVYDTR